MTVGSLSHGARVVTAANFAENSPNDRCCDRWRISPNAAASQKAVVPPLPRATTCPFGRPKSSASPLRIRRTTARTGACRCEVPSSRAAASAISCSGRTLVGPLPNLPSAGLSWSGMTMLVTRPEYLGPACRLGRSNLPVEHLGGAGHFPDRTGTGAGVSRGRADQPACQLLLEYVRRPARRPGAGEHRRGYVGRDLGEVKHDRRPEFDIRLKHPVWPAGPQLGQGRILECQGYLVPGRAEFFGGAPQHSGARVLGPVHPVPEAHQPITSVKHGLHIAFRVAGVLDFLDHVQDAGWRSAVQGAREGTDRAGHRGRDVRSGGGEIGRA